MRDWDPDFEQIVLLYKPLSKCPRQQRNMDGASIRFVIDGGIWSIDLKSLLGENSGDEQDWSNRTCGIGCELPTLAEWFL